MGSGAYSVFIDQQAGGGPAGALERVVPLPPPATTLGWLARLRQSLPQ